MPTLADATEEAFEQLKVELDRARAKFPENAHLIVALGEEFGEVCRAALDSECLEDFRKECLQVAAVAIRLATEGDPGYPSTMAF